jgi:hypothetical protein
VLLRKTLPLLALALIFSGCAVGYTHNVFTRNRVYRKVRVTDLQGHLIADWVAEGRVWRYGKGYRFNAVERLSGGPYPVLSKYPQGRKVVIDGPNIVVMPTGQPLWLYEIENPPMTVTVTERRIETRQIETEGK